MTSSLTMRAPAKIARPLKVLIPLIQSDLERGDRAGMEAYANAGAKLLEAKSQVSHGQWGSWVRKNFDLHIDTARRYMRWARLQSDAEIRPGGPDLPKSMYAMRGDSERERANRVRSQPFREALRDVAPDIYAQEKQTREDEVRLHRDLAEELIDIGYKALATRLHPDKGGSKDAMARLNRVRDELKGIAETRRFV